MFSFLLEGGTTPTTGSPWITLASFALIIVVFYFIFIRPQKKQEKEQNAMRDALQVGDEITTIGGIIGRVVSIKEETVTIETSRDRTKIRFLRSAIRSVDVKAEETKEAYEKLERKQAEKAEKAESAEAPATEDNAEETENK